MNNFLLKLYTKAQILREDHGQDLVEYGLIVGLIALACVVSITAVGTSLSTLFTALATALTGKG